MCEYCELDETNRFWRYKTEFYRSENLPNTRWGLEYNVCDNEWRMSLDY